MIVLSQHKDELGIGVFHTVAFVDDQMQPFDFAQQGPVLDNVLKGGQEHLEITASNIHLQVATHRRRAFVYNGGYGRSPLVEFK